LKEALVTQAHQTAVRPGASSAERSLTPALSAAFLPRCPHSQLGLLVV
jgi:hypothetical protein